MNFETTPRGTSRKREPHTILKTDERSLHQELGGDKFEVAVKNGRCVVTSSAAGARAGHALLQNAIPSDTRHWELRLLVDRALTMKLTMDELLEFVRTL